VSENLAAMSQLVDRLAKNKIYGHEKKGINCVRNVVLGNGRAQVKEQIQTLVGQVMQLAFIDKTPNPCFRRHFKSTNTSKTNTPFR
jgi:Holliday junction resolvasome RuvABC endonuclease subunit